MQQLEEFIKRNDYLPRLRHIQGRTSIAKMYGPRNRCGIYLLLFENGEVYAGQAKDVTRRYVQHRSKHDDITHISFKRVPKKRLNEEERFVIETLEREGFHLRNITYTSYPKGESDFDLIMSVEEQNHWLENGDNPEFKGTRINNDTLRRKYQKNYAALLTKSFSTEAIDALKHYVQVCVPTPEASEITFWSCSCLPSYGEGVLYSRININWQEVFAVYKYEGCLSFSFYLALTPLQDIFSADLELLIKQFSNIYILDRRYKPGGQDQICIEIDGYEEFCRFMDHRHVKNAIRIFNLRLMKKGPCTFGRYHCVDLADRLLA